MKMYALRNLREKNKQVYFKTAAYKQYVCDDDLQMAALYLSIEAAASAAYDFYNHGCEFDAVAVMVNPEDGSVTLSDATTSQQSPDLAPHTLKFINQAALFCDWAAGEGLCASLPSDTNKELLDPAEFTSKFMLNVGIDNFQQLMDYFSFILLSTPIAPQPAQWQPMETAPRDGREFLVVYGGWLFTTGEYTDGSPIPNETLEEDRLEIAIFAEGIQGENVFSVRDYQEFCPKTYICIDGDHDIEIDGNWRTTYKDDPDHPEGPLRLKYWCELPAIPLPNVEVA
ncbi:hypothetical protein [Polycladidibacter hongkongensis]|uniref:hypothetical protein n=1 Tax=Polycladidibacter hongkongensis TaxID=1647556 RepID=UPI00082D9CAE|nr:hypothetical protein [Pseudovibrio hongkongensis]